MMTKREKLYFLIDHIEEARAITPSGQPILVDPTNDLNRRISEVELKQLFTKLEKDEQILKVLQVPSGISRVEIVEDLDPYDPPYQQDDGCWHIELLPAFDSYFAKIQLETEYQKFTGKKPKEAVKPSSGSLMTYEQKLDLIVKALIEARKATRKGQSTTLYLNATNGLDSLDREEIRNILLQLQDEDALKLNPKTNRLLPLSQQPTSPTYFLLDILDGFDGWLENYLMKQKTELSSLDYINMLRIYDIVLDINEQIQLTNKTTVSIHLLPSLVRFSALFPADTIGMRDKYCETRWDSLRYLKEKGVIDEFKHKSAFHRWDTVVSVNLTLSKFDDFYKKIKAEYVKRNKTNKKDEKPKTDNIKIDPKKVKQKVSYNPQKGELDIEGKKVKFKKDSFRAKLLELLLKDDKSRKKEWSWDEVIEAIEDTKDPDLTKEKKKKFYPACDGLSKHIASKTGVNDLLIFNKSTVQLSPKYL
jgi:hypothetical protein